jgi:hypothetical protein
MRGSHRYPFACPEIAVGTIIADWLPAREPVGGQFSRNWTICCPYGPNRPPGAGFRTACGKLLAGFLLLCPVPLFRLGPMVLSES